MNLSATVETKLTANYLPNVPDARMFRKAIIFQVGHCVIAYYFIRVWMFNHSKTESLRIDAKKLEYTANLKNKAILLTVWTCQDHHCVSCFNAVQD